MMPPTAAIHNGSPGGRTSPNNSPVITTLKSPTDDRLPDIRQKKCSVATQVAVDVTIKASALTPNNQTA